MFPLVFKNKVSCIKGMTVFIRGRRVWFYKTVKGGHSEGHRRRQRKKEVRTKGVPSVEVWRIRYA